MVFTVFKRNPKLPRSCPRLLNAIPTDTILLYSKWINFVADGRLIGPLGPYLPRLLSTCPSAETFAVTVEYIVLFGVYCLLKRLLQVPVGLQLVA